MRFHFSRRRIPKIFHQDLYIPLEKNRKIEKIKLKKRKYYFYIYLFIYLFWGNISNFQFFTRNNNHAATTEAEACNFVYNKWIKKWTKFFPLGELIPIGWDPQNFPKRDPQFFAPAKKIKKIFGLSESSSKTKKKKRKQKRERESTYLVPTYLAGNNK